MAKKVEIPKFKKPKTLVIDRSKWGCGSVKKRELFKIMGKTAMLNSKTGKMCCLGFDAVACGVSKEHLKDVGEPCDVADVIAESINEKIQNERPDDYLYHVDIPGLTRDGNNTGFSDDAIGVNDDNEITQEEREQQLISLFKKKGTVLSFVGKFPREVQKAFQAQDEKIIKKKAKNEKKQ